MKKFLSVLLVAVLALTCCSVAFAAEPGSVYVETKTAKPGETVLLTVEVSGEFANYEIIFNVANKLTIEKFNGIIGNKNNGKVAFAMDENVEAHSFTISIKVAEDAEPGKYPVNADVLFVADRNLDLLDVADAVGYIIIEGSTEPTTPSEEPTTPSEEPTTPSEEPTTPSEEPTTPSEEPTTPGTEPSEPDVTEPDVTEPKPTDPEETKPAPTDPSIPDDEPNVGKYDFAVVNGIMMSVMVLSAAAYVVLKRNAVK